MDGEIATLRNDLAEAVNMRSQSIVSTASRPVTPDSIQQLRYDIQAAMDAEVPEASVTSTVLEAIWDLDPQWVKNKLQADRDSTVENANPRWRELGCWMKAEDDTSDSATGYLKVNLRNTYRPGSRPKRLIGVQPFRHQLAVVAAGLGQNLLKTSKYGGTHEVCCAEL